MFYAMKIRGAITFLSLLLSVLMLGSCTGVQKHITVVVREQGSGTREAFDRVVTDGVHFLEEKDENGKKVYNSQKTAIQQTKTGTVLWTVSSDPNAIGYVSIGSVNDSVRLISIDGVFPSEESVLSGEYKIQRPYVIMTSEKTVLTDRAADFLAYLESDAARVACDAADCIFLSDADMRGGEGNAPIEVAEYVKQPSMPVGDKIVVRGSTSVEKVIMSAAKAYADMYGVNAEEIFDIQLEGSSVGRKAVLSDARGNVIGLSSASVSEEGIRSFNLCVDAIGVVVNKENTKINDLSLAELYGIFSGQIIKFDELYTEE